MPGRASTPTALARRDVEAAARSVVDYTLARRTTLHALATGRVSTDEVCDAQTYLVRAARYHGESTGECCPVCKREGLRQVTYTYGECFGATGNGRAHAVRDLAGLADAYPEFNVYLVEVCGDCRWNHLLAAYVLGTGAPARGRRRSSPRV
jgi:hypothetical protein